MPKLFGIDVAGIVNKEMGKLLLPVTLQKVSTQTRTTDNLSGGTNPEFTNYSGKGFIEDYNDYVSANSGVERGDKKITVLGGSLSTNIKPAANDRIIIEGSTYNIVRVKRDPAGATYECQSRGI